MIDSLGIEEGGLEGATVGVLARPVGVVVVGVIVRMHRQLWLDGGWGLELPLGELAGAWTGGAEGDEGPRLHLVGWVVGGDADGIGRGAEGPAVMGDASAVEVGLVVACNVDIAFGVD